jgi:hypothetical protein
LDGVLFDKDQTTLIQCPAGKIGSYSIPNGVTNFDGAPFGGCNGLTNVTIPNGVTSIVSGMFEFCYSLTTVNMPNSITSIGDYAFYTCVGLTSIIIPNGVTSIGDEAFGECNLSTIYFLGNAPQDYSDNIFDDDPFGTVYYLPGTTGWGSRLEFFRTVLWIPQVQTADASFGVQSNEFGFTTTWTSNMVVVVEACTNLANPIWSPVATNTLSGDSFYFSDPEWTNYLSRFYRVSSQ